MNVHDGDPTLGDELVKLWRSGRGRQKTGTDGVPQPVSPASKHTHAQTNLPLAGSELEHNARVSVAAVWTGMVTTGC